MKRSALFSRLLPGLLACAWLAGGPCAPARAQLHEGKELVAASLVADAASARPGSTFTAGLLLRMAPGWHTYWKDPGDSGLPTSIRWELPPGFEAGEILWPAHAVIEEPGGIRVNAYRDEMLLMVPIRVAPDVPPGPATLKARAEWLVCEAICIPGQADLELAIRIAGADAAPAPSSDAALFEKYRALLPPGEAGASGASERTPGTSGAAAAQGAEGPAGFLLILLSGFLGGMILNLMPCVLPVITLKIAGFVRQAEETPSRILALGLAFAAGIFAWFLGLAALAVGFRAAGGELNWAFQFQNPFFLLGMGAVVLLFALNLFGVFEVFLPSPAGSKLSGLSGREGLFGAFLHGMFATLLATPCTGPFFGTALGFALSQPAPATFSVFAAMAAGMSLPYLLLCARPGWMRVLPKPGPWMERLKQGMGFPLLATVLWLLWVIARQRGADAAGWASALLLSVAVAGWIYGAFATSRQRGGTRLAARIAILLVLAAGALGAGPRFAAARPEEGREEKGFAARLDEALATGRTVFVDFTADWCLNCKVNERLVLNTPEIREAFARGGVVFLKADWTKGDPEITAALKSFGRAGVPLYVVYPDGDPARAKLLPELLTKQIVLEAVGTP